MRRDALLVAGFTAGFAALTAGLAAGGPLIDLDLAVHEWARAHRPPAAETSARLLNRLGQGGVLLGICGVLAGGLALLRWHAAGWWRRPGCRAGPGRNDRRLRSAQPAGGRWRPAVWWPGAQPLLYVLVAVGLVYLTVAGVKQATERGAPSSPLPPEQTVPLFGSLPPAEYDTGYPSGHAVNTIVWYGVLVLLVSALLHAYGRAGLPPAVRAVVRVAPPLLVVSAQTYLSFHWLTDSLAGLALGLAIDRTLSLLRGRFQ